MENEINSTISEKINYQTGIKQIEIDNGFMNGDHCRKNEILILAQKINEIIEILNKK